MGLFTTSVIGWSLMSTPPARAKDTADWPAASAEAVGFSTQRLLRIDALMQRMVDQKEFSGIVTMAARHGKIFQSNAYGLMNIERGAPMRKDTIFRIYSMSKPITGVAMMILYEEGKWNPKDPISKFIPEFANLKVFKGLDADGKLLLEDPAHPPTMGELMSHLAGFSYGFGSNGFLDKLYIDKDGQNTVLGAPSLQVMIDRLATIPLLDQPGTRWVYSVSADIQGYLIEKLSGMPLRDFLKERIFDALRMADTDFYVPRDKATRFANSYTRTDRGELVAFQEPRLPHDFDKEPSLPFGGSGLVSTAGDYLKFAQMLLNGGELGGVRILGPETVKLMSANHLPEAALTGKNWLNVKFSDNGLGFGFDFAVIRDPALASCPCGKGTYFWAGAAGTWFWIDPTDDVVFVGMVQRMNTPPNVQFGEVARQLTYQALIDLKR
jgi:CubicO group peptidase (beta-lactamase class C family)